MKTRLRVSSVLLLGLGLWLAFVPSLLFPSPRQATSYYLVAAVLFGTAVASFRFPRVGFIALVLGLFLGLMPLFHGYMGTAHQLHDVGVGICSVVLGFAIARRSTTRVQLPG